MATKKKDEASGSASTKPSWVTNLENQKSGGASGTGSSGYRPLGSSGNDYASMVGMSDLDKAALDAAGQSWNKANAAGDQAGMDAAHRQAEAIRSQYGYSGGSDGSQYIPFGTSKKEFSYSSAPTYTSKYQSQIDELTEAILGRDPFEYNYLEDPNYQQYEESYTRSGQRAMQDTLGQVAARTGGLASSYATTASQQTYDNYMAQLADKIPELRQAAYAMYQDEGDTMRANLDMLLALEQGDYAKYQDLLGQYNTDRNFDYGAFRDEVGDDRYNLEWNYNAGRDQIEDQRYEDETAWNREQYESETEYNRALEKAQTLAAAGDFSGYKDLGYTDEEIATLQATYDRAQAASRLSSGGGSSGSSGSSGGSSGSGSGSGSSDIYSQMYQAGIRSEGDAYAWLLASGYNTTQAGKLAGYFTQWMESGGSTESDYDGATVDMTSVINLGYGPISEEYLAELEARGEIESYVEDGKIKFRRTNRTSENTGFGILGNLGLLGGN